MSNINVYISIKSNVKYCTEIQNKNILFEAHGKISVFWLYAFDNNFQQGHEQSLVLTAHKNNNKHLKTSL